MRGLTSPLWPIRYKPLPDELLSCWLVRLAHGHGLKVQTFCNQIFGSRLQVWNRDVDRLAPAWLVEELSRRTGTPLDVARSTTLRAYEGSLYQHFRSAGALQWILTLKMYHRKREGFGLQFCPTCLASDPIPYFRKRWRVACLTMCHRHKTLLLDRCPACQAAIAVHRLDMTKAKAINDLPLCYCHHCGFDLRASETAAPNQYDRRASSALADLGNALASGNFAAVAEAGEAGVLHHLCGLLTSRYKHCQLREYVCNQLHVRDIPIRSGKIFFEARPLLERHHLMQLGAWLLMDLGGRLEGAWKAGAVRYNVLLKDYADPPRWYVEIVGKFSNWRDR
jgi:hypothetical protein